MDSPLLLPELVEDRDWRDFLLIVYFPPPRIFYLATPVLFGHTGMAGIHPNVMNRTLFLFSSFPKMELGPLEKRLLHALWECRSATVRELIDDGNIHLAYTTVMTTLDRLYKKNLLSRVVEGRAFRYSPRQTQEELQKEAASKAIRQLLSSNSASSLPLSYLVEAVGQHDAKLLEELQELVERKRRELRRKEKHDV